MPKVHDAKWAENKKERDAKFAEKRGQRDKAGNDNAGSKDSNARRNSEVSKSVSPKWGRILWDLSSFPIDITFPSLIKTTIKYLALFSDIIWNLPESTFWLLWWFIGTATLWFLRNIGVHITNNITTTLFFGKDLATFNEKRGDCTLWQIFADPGFYEDVTIIKLPA
jgi:hypothetical protein